MKLLASVLSVAVGFLVFSASQPTRSAEFSLKFGWTTGAGDNDPYAVGARAFKEEVEKRSDGRIQVALFPNRALGDEKPMLEGMRLGTVDMALISSAVSSQVAPAFFLTDLPFMFNDERQARAVLDGPVGQQLADHMKEKGVIVLGFMEGGFRAMVNNVRPVLDTKDVAGVKYRVMQSPVFIDMFAALKGNAVPMTWGEVFTALQQGTIDGLEAPPLVIEQSKFSGIAKYVSLTNHTYSALELMISRRRFEGLPADLQQAVTDAAKAAVSTQRRRSYEDGLAVLESLKREGMQVNAIKDLKPFRDAVAPIYEGYREKIGSDLLDMALKARGP